MHFILFVWRALSSGALSYQDISGNIRVKSQFENVTSRQFSMKISILQGLNTVCFDIFRAKCIFQSDTLAKSPLKNVHFIRFVWRALSSGALSYQDISGNIRVKSQFENVTSRQFSMKISILQGLNKAS